MLHTALISCIKDLSSTPFCHFVTLWKHQNRIKYSFFTPCHYYDILPLSYVDNKAIKDELRILNESLEKLFSLKSDLKESLKESQEHVGMERALFLRDHTTPIVSEMCKIMEMLEDMVGEDLWCIPSYEDMLQAL